jgi:hypothetical protein
MAGTALSPSLLTAAVRQPWWSLKDRCRARLELTVPAQKQALPTGGSCCQCSAPCGDTFSCAPSCEEL